MRIIHPFIRRIRTEREVLAVINSHKSLFNNELTGLSPDAVESWFTKMPEEVKTLDSISKIKAKIISIGRFTKLASNGSHRGAMVAMPTNAEVATKLIKELKATLATIS